MNAQQKDRIAKAVAEFYAKDWAQERPGIVGRGLGGGLTANPIPTPANGGGGK